MITDVSNDESESVRNGVRVELFANLSFVVKCKKQMFGYKKTVYMGSFFS